MPLARSIQRPTPSVPPASVAPAAQPQATTPPVTAVATPEQAQRGLMLFADAPATGQSALSAALAVVESGGGGGALFPTLTLSGGSNGGLLVPLTNIPAEIADLLPQGRRAVDAVFLDYRLSVIGWAVGYNERAPLPGATAADPGASSKPVFSAAVSKNNAADAGILMRACKNYQFTKGAQKAKFNHAESGVGHLFPQLEMLVYLPGEVNQLVVISSARSYNSVERTLTGLGRLEDPTTHQLGKFPCSIRPVSEEVAMGQFTVKVHSLEITPSTNAASPAWPAFGAWLEAARNDPAVVGKVNEWTAAGDHLMTDAIRAALQTGAAL